MLRKMFPAVLVSLLFLALTVVPSAVPALSIAGPMAAATPDFSISVSPAIETRKRGTGAVYTLTIDSLNGFSGTVDVNISGAPPATSGDGTLSASVAAGQSVTLNPAFQTSKIGTPTGTFTLTFDATSGNLSHTVQAILQTR